MLLEITQRREISWPIPEKILFLKAMRQTTHIPINLLNPFINWQTIDSDVSSLILKNLQVYSKYFKIINNREIFDYFLDNSEKAEDIFILLHNAYILNLKYFGEESQLVLSLNHDPEFNDKFLRLSVLLPEYPTDFIKKVRAMRDEFSRSLSRRKFWIFISTEKPSVV